ncbi:MarR family winged helix-turn-helix transcriptional regulator [Aquincola sp. MAHUQ-54]|uniref:MarR family winged helix-turn-helix transcriptional regulator n=1 Tax=Aquincola agrisoli TaxID=3119538 RepID=A0AAW9QD77_9BURK
MTQKTKKIASASELRHHDPEDLITFRMSALSQLLGRVVEASVSGELGLSSRQWRVLVILNRLGEATSGDVARVSRLDHSQVSRASHELVGKGLIAMHTDGADKRRQMLKTTPEGIEVLRRGIVGSQHRQQRLRARISDEDYAVFKRVIEALTDESQRLLEEAKDGGGAP